MNTENETGVKVPKGQINYNTVAGSLGLAAFAENRNGTTHHYNLDEVKSI